MFVQLYFEGKYWKIQLTFNFKVDYVKSFEQVEGILGCKSQEN